MYIEGIIVEYDTPIQQGHNRNFYEKIILFMRNLFSGGLKDSQIPRGSRQMDMQACPLGSLLRENKHLSYGFLTGILRVAKESIFSGSNNLSINSILDNKYSQYFGFTADEVKEMAQYYGVPEKYEEICAWYNGYRFGKTNVFNPWSVINYFYRECEPQAYWLSTGSNEIIGEILAEANEDVYNRLNALLQGNSFTTLIDTSVIYPQVKKNPAFIYSLLLVAGYLTVVKTVPSFSGDYLCEVALPNREITYVYRKEILEKQLQKLLLESVSYYDTAGENFYHGLVLGLCAIMDNRYDISSNRESGKGRYAIQLMPKTTGLPGILIELKAKGVQKILKFGVAFCCKAVEIESI